MNNLYRATVRNYDVDGDFTEDVVWCVAGTLIDAVCTINEKHVDDDAELADVQRYCEDDQLVYVSEDI